MNKSESMGRVRSKNTSPELFVRRLLRELGYTGYRLHYKDLPGKPDVVFIGRKKAILVNGCFWHAHDCKKGQSIPQTNKEFWEAKIEKNRKRDLENQERLEKLSWSILIIWECELQDKPALIKKIQLFMRSETFDYEKE